VVGIRSIASRDVTKARQAAQALGIAKAYGSYEDLLADDEIEAIYNRCRTPARALVQQSRRGRQACPLRKADRSQRPRSAIVNRGARPDCVKIQEALWCAHIPMAGRARTNRVRADWRASFCCRLFQFFNRDPATCATNRKWWCALMDIGCYPITMSRFIFQRRTAPRAGID